MANALGIITLCILAALILGYLSVKLTPQVSPVEYRYFPRHLLDNDSLPPVVEAVFDGEDVWYRSISKEKLP